MKAKSLFQKIFGSRCKEPPEIVVCGDSWVFGSEIVDPELAKNYPKKTHPTVYDHFEENDAYRRDRIFTKYLSDIAGVQVTNLGWPADDNGIILKRALNYVTQNYIVKNRPTDNLFLIVGWSSPERNHFYYQDEDFNDIFRIWPNDRNFRSKQQEQIWKLYVEHIAYPEQYFTDFVLQVTQLQNFCLAHNVNWMCFNSFYQTSGLGIRDWHDVNISEELEMLYKRVGAYTYITHQPDSGRQLEFMDYRMIWNQIDPVRYYNKDQKFNTFKTFIQRSGRPYDEMFSGYHPSPQGHEVWANELFSYIVKNNLWHKPK